MDLQRSHLFVLIVGTIFDLGVMQDDPGIGLNIYNYTKWTSNGPIFFSYFCFSSGGKEALIRHARPCPVIPAIPAIPVKWNTDPPP